MTMVIAGELPAPIAAWRDERQRLGQDRYDEVWEGVHHVVPGPSDAHAYVDGEVGAALRPRVKAAGLYFVTTTNLGTPDDYRIPDAMVRRTKPAGAIYTEAAALVVEVLSPGDETFAKFPFYAARGVEELLVADPVACSVRIWQLRDGSYAETGRSDVLDVTAQELTGEIDWP